MAKIRINLAAREAIRSHAMHGRLHETAVQVGPDLYEVEVDQITVEMLERRRKQLALQSVSDVILWLSSNARGHQ